MAATIPRGRLVKARDVGGILHAGRMRVFISSVRRGLESEPASRNVLRHQ